MVPTLGSELQALSEHLDEFNEYFPTETDPQTGCMWVMETFFISGRDS
jgi:hypothetical protein